MLLMGATMYKVPISGGLGAEPLVEGQGAKPPKNFEQIINFLAIFAII